MQVAQPTGQRSWRRLERALQALEGVPTDAVVYAPWRVNFLRADLAYAKGLENGDVERGRSEALDVLQQATKNYAQSPEFWRQLSLVYQRLEAVGDADQAVDRLTTLGSSPVDIVLARAGPRTVAEGI